MKHALVYDISVPSPPDAKSQRETRYRRSVCSQQQRDLSNVLFHGCEFDFLERFATNLAFTAQSLRVDAEQGSDPWGRGTCTASPVYVAKR